MPDAPRQLRQLCCSTYYRDPSNNRRKFRGSWRERERDASIYCRFFRPPNSSRTRSPLNISKIHEMGHVEISVLFIVSRRDHLENEIRIIFSLPYLMKKKIRVAVNKKERKKEKKERRLIESKQNCDRGDVTRAL